MFLIGVFRWFHCAFRCVSWCFGPGQTNTEMGKLEEQVKQLMEQVSKADCIRSLVANK